MLDITIIAYGKIKDKTWQTAVQEYLKRLRPYARIKVEELKAESFSTNNKDEVKKIESQRLLERLRSYADSEIRLLSEMGEEMDSPQLAAWFEKTAGPIVLVIGGTLGFDKEMIKKYKSLSLSRLTFPHELARVILLEQIYRATSIIQGKDYHY